MMPRNNFYESQSRYQPPAGYALVPARNTRGRGRANGGGRGAPQGRGSRPQGQTNGQANRPRRDAKKQEKKPPSVIKGHDAIVTVWGALKGESDKRNLLNTTIIATADDFVKNKATVCDIVRAHRLGNVFVYKFCYITVDISDSEDASGAKYEFNLAGGSKTKRAAPQFSEFRDGFTPSDLIGHIERNNKMVYFFCKPDLSVKARCSSFTFCDMKDLPEMGRKPEKDGRFMVTYHDIMSPDFKAANSAAYYRAAAKDSDKIGDVGINHDTWKHLKADLEALGNVAIGNEPTPFVAACAKFAGVESFASPGALAATTIDKYMSLKTASMIGCCLYGRAVGSQMSCPGASMIGGLGMISAPALSGAAMSS